MISTTTGPYPRTGSKTADSLRKELNKISENKEITQSLQENLAQEITNELTHAGIDLPNSGLTNIHDEITWPLESTKGITFGGIKKIFHTNTHYKEPIIIEEITNNEKNILASQTKLSKKIELPGPYTLATHSILGETSPYKNLEELAHAYTTFLKNTLDTLPLDSVQLLQFNEPAIIAYGKQKIKIDILNKLYTRLLDGIKTKTAVWTYYGKYNQKTLDILFSLPANIVGLDFVWNPELINILKKKNTRKGIGFGIIDCGDRGYLTLEDKNIIVKKIKELKNNIDLNQSYIAPNATLEHLPRNYALQKAQLTADICKEMNA